MAAGPFGFAQGKLESRFVSLSQTSRDKPVTSRSCSARAFINLVLFKFCTESGMWDSNPRPSRTISGRQDLNLRPLAPKASALPLRHSPIWCGTALVSARGGSAFGGNCANPRYFLYRFSFVLYPSSDDQ